MTGAEVRKLNIDVLKGKLKEARQELFELRMKAATEKVEDNSRFRKSRKTVARLLTEVNARRHAQSSKS
jgi:large subunit ribosomal protein L29